MVVYGYDIYWILFWIIINNAILIMCSAYVFFKKSRTFSSGLIWRYVFLSSSSLSSARVIWYHSGINILSYPNQFFHDDFLAMFPCIFHSKNSSFSPSKYANTHRAIAERSLLSRREQSVSDESSSRKNLVNVPGSFPSAQNSIPESSTRTGDPSIV